ncbi:hypothetical protein BH24CHL7_BH24CHL7_15830 [soil metagenome]
MDQIAQWRPAEPAGPEGQTEQKKAGALDDGRFRMVLVGAVGALVLAAAGVVLWATTPQPQVVLQPDGGEGDALAIVPASGAPASLAAVPTELVVDVEGAVQLPGLHRLAPGSRVGDAITVAGGYSTQVDIVAAALRLNLAQRLADGDKIQVPARGDEAVALPSVPHGTPQAPGWPGTSGSGEGGLINLNSATDAQLDTLPGIGPVTAGKIIAAREEAPFTSVDELLGRKVVGPATFEKVRDLVTVGP